MASIKDWVLKKEASDDDPLDEIEDSLEEMRPTDDEADVLAQIEQTLEEMENRREAEIQDHVDIIIDAFNVLKDKVESRIAGIERIEPEKGDPGPRGERGQDGVIGKDGRDGRDGKDGKDGVDGQDGVSVTDAKIDFDGSLVITLSTGREINVGEVVPFDVAEKIRVITSNGGYSGGGGASLPDQTGNAGEFLTTDGTNASWGPAQKTITSGTAAPSGGVDGDIYLQFV
jgi:hypothetical protein